MPQHTPRKVAVSRARAGHPSEAARAFDAIAPELDRVAPDELLPINVAIPRVVSTVLGAEPILLSYAAEIKAQLPKHPQADLTKLRTYGLAALRAQPARRPMRNLPRPRPSPRPDHRDRKTRGHPTGAGVRGGPRAPYPGPRLADGPGRYVRVCRGPRDM